MVEGKTQIAAAIIVRGWIQDLYGIEKRAPSTEERATLRATESAAVLNKMRTWMHEQRILTSGARSDCDRTQTEPSGSEYRDGTSGRRGTA